MAATPQEQRKLRLKNDYQEMVNIRGEIVQWKATKGAAPFVEEYEIRIKFKTIIDVERAEPKYREDHIVKLQLSSRHPKDPPVATMISSPPPFHPNWYKNGKWCHGSWVISEGLGHFVVRLIRTLNFDLEITDPGSPANSDAKNWFNEKSGSGIFPLSRSILPDPTKKRKTFNIKQRKKDNSGRFRIND